MSVYPGTAAGSSTERAARAARASSLGFPSPPSPPSPNPSPNGRCRGPTDGRRLGGDSEGEGAYKTCEGVWDSMD